MTNHRAFLRILNFSIVSSFVIKQTLDRAGSEMRAESVDQEIQLNGASTAASCRYSGFLEEVGLGDEVEVMNQITKLPSKRAISTYDVFCNRDLRLEGIRAVGFDMDYTIAQYDEVTFAELSFEGAKRKLVEQLGYPEEVLDFKFDHTYWARGLIIDTARGNFLKIDRHKYVRVAHHGFERMSSETRKYLYSRSFNKVVSFSEKQYVNMDTLFQFVDAHLYASIIDLKDNGEFDVLDLKTYEEIYREMRECVDLCHRDGVIKDEVARNPAKYILKDKGMIPMLKRFREQGVKVFLLTNSLWEYTSTVMNFLYHGELVDEAKRKENDWLELFDLAVVGACKPAYMLDPYLNLFRVNPTDGTLRNTDGVYEINALEPNGAEKFLAKGKVFQGGNWKHLHALMETQAGEEILYVGDHLYSDVLRSKRTLGWRSAFVMPELEEEMRVFEENLPLFNQIKKLRQLREELGTVGENIRREDVGSSEELEGIEKSDVAIKAKLTELARSWHARFHPHWGALFHAGYQDSRFAFYVQNYACLYTSRATNLGLASTERSFRSGFEMLPHDRLLANADSTELTEEDPWIE